MKLSDDYIIVEKIEEDKKDGFQTVEVQDSFVYKGKIVQIPARPAYLGNYALQVGETVLWAKGSPDTHEIEGKKFVLIRDVIAAL